MNTLSVHPEFPELELSLQPTERRLQVRVLENVLAVVEHRHLQGRAMDWSALPRFADTPAVAEVTQARMDQLSGVSGFEPFEGLKSRRDATGVVRLR